jgi:hypothetical protein
MIQNLEQIEYLCPEVNRRTLQGNLKTMVDKAVVLEKATSPTDPTKRYLLMEGLLR